MKMNDIELAIEINQNNDIEETINNNIKSKSKCINKKCCQTMSCSLLLLLLAILILTIIWFARFLSMDNLIVRTKMIKLMQNGVYTLLLFFFVFNVLHVELII